MSSVSEHSIELAEGNPTLHTLLSEALEDEGFEVRDEPGESLADLFVADVDSGLESLEDRFDAYRSSSRPVLVCGVRASREAYDVDPWLTRPFEPAEFVAACRRALGIEPEDSFAELDEVDESEEEGSTTTEVDYESPDDELAADSESEGVAESAGDGEPPEAEGEGEEEDVLEIDNASSMVLDVHEVEELEDGYGTGGRFGGAVGRESLDVEALEREAEELEASEDLSDPDANPTLPEVPDYDEDDSGGSRPEESSSIRQVDSNAGPGSGAGTTGARRNPTAGSGPVEPDSVVGAQVPAGDGSPPAPRADEPEHEAEWPSSSPRRVASEFERELAEVASLLAESWGRLGLTARWEDRAERLERVFSALLEGGIERAADELDRIPPAHGFTGVLEVFSPFEIVRLIRRRDYLGRLELSNESGGFVLYFDGNRLVGIDDLEGRSEAMLLDCLQESASVDDELYRKLRSTVEDSLAAPLEMRLRTENLVTEEQLLDARRTRAKWVVKEVLNANTGNFAFIHGGDESGQPWPVNELGLSVDVIMLELLRDGAVERRKPTPESPEAYVTAGHRLGDEQQTALALVERDILGACSTPASLDQIVREVGGDRSSVREATERLWAVGFLHPTTVPGESGSRSGPHRAASDSEVTAARKRPEANRAERGQPAEEEERRDSPSDRSDERPMQEGDGDDAEAAGPGERESPESDEGDEP